VYLSTDELLALALPLVYLSSSVLLLERNELVLVAAGGGSAQIDLGSDFLLAGRRPAIANPLTPYRAVLRGTWSLKDAPAPGTVEVAQSIEQVSRALRPIRILSSIAAASAVIGAPWALLLSQPQWFLLFWTLCVAASIACGIVALRRRAVLRLSRGMVVWMTFVAAVCIPFAGILSRTFASCVRPRVRLPEFAEHQLRGAQWQRFRDQFVGLLQSLRFQADDGSENAAIIDRLVNDVRKETA
jgi:hypothetical protein